MNLLDEIRTKNNRCLFLITYFIILLLSSFLLNLLYVSLYWSSVYIFVLFFTHMDIGFCFESELVVRRISSIVTNAVSNSCPFSFGFPFASYMVIVSLV